MWCIMTPSHRSQPPLVLMRADATPTIGVGHAMRLLALAQELLARGTAVHLAGRLDIAWVEQAYREAGVGLHAVPATPDDLLALARQLGVSHCVLDGYDLGPEWGHTLRAAGLPVLAMIDGDFAAEQDADLYVDQNPGSPPRLVEGGRRSLAGAPYTLFRDDVLALRASPSDELPSTTTGGAGEGAGPLRVLMVFGGTDPLGAAPVLAPLVLETGLPVDVTVISADDSWARSLAVAGDQRLTVIRPVTDLAARARASDLVVTASGSSVWELLCLGVPIAVVCVIDNQTPGYEMTVARGLAAGLGHLAALRDDPATRRAAVEALTQTLTSARLRADRSARGQALLDGRGRERVADALLALPGETHHTG